MTVFYLSILLFGAYFLVSSFLAFAPASYSTGFVRLLDKVDASIDQRRITWVAMGLGLFYVTEYCWLRWL